MWQHASKGEAGLNIFGTIDCKSFCLLSSQPSSILVIISPFAAAAAAAAALLLVLDNFGRIQLKLESLKRHLRRD